MLATAKRLMPPALAGYRLRWLRADLLAGLTLAAVAIPEAMGYSSIAHVPPVAGIYTLILPAVVFALLGSARLMVVGADSATAALLASGIAGLGVAGLARDTSEWLAWASLIAIVTGVMLAAARLLRLGFLGDFLSSAVLVGFLAGTGLSVLTGQVPGMLGIDGGEGRVWQRWATIVTHLGHVDAAAVGFAALTLLALIGGARFAPRFPMAVVVVVASIVVVSVAGWGTSVPVVGALHGGWPQFGWPSGITLADAGRVVTISLGATVVILAQSAATARSFAQRHGESADVDRDILGLAGANLVAGFSGTFVVNGSPTRTALLDEQRGRTQVANLVVAAIALIVVVYFDGLLANLPHAVLAAIVSVIAARLIDVSRFRRIWRMRRVEFGIAVVAGAVVVVFGVEVGVITAMVVSLLELVRRQYRPEKFLVGVGDGGTRRFEAAQPGRQSLPGLIIFRYDADLFYANAGRFADDVTALVRGAPEPVRWLVLDASAMSDVDYSASTVLRDLISYIHSTGAHFVLAGVDPELQHTLAAEGILADLDPDHVYASVGEALRAYLARYPDAEPPAAATKPAPTPNPKPKPT